MHRFGCAVFRDKETAKKLIKKVFIIVKAFEEGKEKIITVAIKKFLCELKLLYKQWKCNIFLFSEYWCSCILNSQSRWFKWIYSDVASNSESTSNIYKFCKDMSRINYLWAVKFSHSGGPVPGISQLQVTTGLDSIVKYLYYFYR